MPEPPQRSQIGAPRKPSSPIRAKSSRWTSPLASHSRMCGRISASTKARADSRTSLFSSVREKSITPRRIVGAFEGLATISRNRRAPGAPGALLLSETVARSAPPGEEPQDVFQAEPSVAAPADPVERQLAPVAEALHGVDVEVEHLGDLTGREH